MIWDTDIHIIHVELSQNLAAEPLSSHVNLPGKSKTNLLLGTSDRVLPHCYKSATEALWKLTQLAELTSSPWKISRRHASLRHGVR
jgi:hypothetical protein